MEQAEFEHIARQVRQKAVRTALAYSVGTEKAEDIAQDVMLRLWTIHEEITGLVSAEKLAVCIARNLSADYYRKRRTVSLTKKHNTIDEKQPQPDIYCEINENQEWLIQRMEALPPAEHRILKLRQVELCLPYDLHTALDLMTTVVYVLESGSDHVHVVVGVCAAADAQTQEVVATETVLTSDGITVSEQITDLAATDTGLAVELDCEHLGGELLLGHLVEHLVGVDEEGVAADRTLIRNAILVELLCKILNLLDAGLEHVELRVLVKTDSESRHVTTVHTAVCQEALEGDEELLGALIYILPAGCDEATHVHETVFLRRHRHAVGKSEHLAADLLDCGVLELGLTHLDEICVLCETSGVEDV